LGPDGLSAIFDALCYRSLAKAHQTGDRFLVYPLARGAAPIFILAWSVLLLNERPSVGRIIGIGVSRSSETLRASVRHAGAASGVACGPW
jgi:uncharacterized membrane protein